MKGMLVQVSGMPTQASGMPAQATAIPGLHWQLTYLPDELPRAFQKIPTFSNQLAGWDSGSIHGKNEL